MAADEEIWRDIKAAYTGKKEKVSDIAARFGIPIRSIYAKAEKQDWPRRRKRQTQDTGAMRDAVVRQLYRRMSQRLKKMERMSAKGAHPEAGDPDDRMLISLIKQFEKLTGLHGTAERERKPGRARTASPASEAPETQATTLDAERLREEIVGRLERLHAERRRKNNSE